MKRIYLCCLAMLLSAAAFVSWAAGNRTQQLYLLAGELGNSSAACKADIDSIFPRLQAMSLNTVLVPAYWDLLEPEEGVFDFTLTDYAIDKARQCDLQIVFLWFGAWKNSMSCYAPAWFKLDYERFPRARTSQGKPLEIATPFSEAVYQADRNAFVAWLSHVAEKDREHGTVAMLQIENEIGMLDDARDHCDTANAAYEAWIKENGNLAQQYAQADVDERFMAEAYAKYVERLAQEARQITDIPLYVNAALNSRGRKPGEYPAGGPLAHLMDIWKANAPTIDFMSPDIYDSGYKSWLEQYAVEGNTLFIPEIRRDENCGAKAFYAFGEKDAIGFSPFAIEDSPMPTRLTDAYHCLSQLKPYVVKYRGTDAMHGVLFDQVDRDTVIVSDGLRLKCAHFFTLPWDSRATDGSKWPEGAAIIMQIAPMEYLVAGSGIVVSFDTADASDSVQALGEDGYVVSEEAAKGNAGVDASDNMRIGFLSCDQVKIAEDGQLSYVRRLNGDQDHQGRHVRIGVDDFQILHVKLYTYK